jgi:hypothetical protein
MGRVAGLAAVAACVVAVGCAGGNGGTPKNAAPTITRADFIAQGNAICQRMNDQLNGLPPPGSDPKAAADTLEVVNSIIVDTLANLRALGIPTADEPAVQGIYAQIGVALHDATQLLMALRAGDEQAVAELQALVQKDEAAANDSLAAYGLAVCAE